MVLSTFPILRTRRFKAYLVPMIFLGLFFIVPNVHAQVYSQAFCQVGTSCSDGSVQYTPSSTLSGDFRASSSNAGTNPFGAAGTDGNLYPFVFDSNGNNLNGNLSGGIACAGGNCNTAHVYTLSDLGLGPLSAGHYFLTIGAYTSNQQAGFNSSCGAGKTVSQCRAGLLAGGDGTSGYCDGNHCAGIPFDIMSSGGGGGGSSSTISYLSPVSTTTIHTYPDFKQFAFDIEGMTLSSTYQAFVHFGRGSGSSSIQYLVPSSPFQGQGGTTLLINKNTILYNQAYPSSSLRWWTYAQLFQDGTQVVGTDMFFFDIVGNGSSTGIPTPQYLPPSNSGQASTTIGNGVVLSCDNLLTTPTGCFETFAYWLFVPQVGFADYFNGQIDAFKNVSPFNFAYEITNAVDTQLASGTTATADLGFNLTGHSIGSSTFSVVLSGSSTLSNQIGSSAFSWWNNLVLFLTSIGFGAGLLKFLV